MAWEGLEQVASLYEIFLELANDSLKTIANVDEE